MKALVVFAHPEQRSFNGQLKDAILESLAQQGATVEVSDLYAMGFDPVESAVHFHERKRVDVFDVQTEQRHAYEAGTSSPDVNREIGKLLNADLVVFQFPIWWFSMPAILKGWLDRVFVYGLFTSRQRYDEGFFSGRRAIVSVTAGGPEPTFSHSGRNGDLDLILWPLHFTTWAIPFYRRSQRSVSPPQFGMRAYRQTLYDSNSTKLTFGITFTTSTI
jgi:NAD(P)H dehydrogenase (quinone)